jgi:Uma2 family endonuclease
MLTEELPVLAIDTPVMFEDEGQEHMGDSREHSDAMRTLYGTLETHFATLDMPATVLNNINVYYHAVKRWAYVSPDVMVVPIDDLPRTLKSYRVGKTGPAPVLVFEVLSERTFQQGDLTLKPEIYHDLGVSEYWLVDVTGQFLEPRLMRKTRDGEGWINEPDEGYGLTSDFGFRVWIDEFDQVQLANTATGRRYFPPSEMSALQMEVERLKAEIARLKAQLPSSNGL